MSPVNTSCVPVSVLFCNTADNRDFDQAEKRGLRFVGLTPDELVAQLLSYVEKSRRSYQDFWEEHVHPK